ncbi:hypothetical protein B566_EDAN014319 [Ephemera danica]|nr:hypothetical protein B566_EDAN014319 [Ephemera danica]
MASWLRKMLNIESEEVMDLSLLPYELLVHILSFVDSKTQVFICRLVCKSWREIVEKESLRKQAILNKKITKTNQRFPWFVYYACNMGLFGKNLLLNTCGKDKFKHWTITENRGHKWRVETPTGCKPVPEEALLENGIDGAENVSCFSTSFGNCAKHQIIKLKDHKIGSKMMDEVKPSVVVSEWYAPRFDCGSSYKMTVELLNSNLRVVQSKSFNITMEAWTEAVWEKAVIVLKDYVGGVRFIRFKHEGQDTQFWAGHYGSKMTLASVQLQLPTADNLQVSVE